MVRCKTCGNELYSRRVLDSNAKATGEIELTCRNTHCPDYDRKTFVELTDLVAMEEEEVAQWGI